MIFLMVLYFRQHTINMKNKSTSLRTKTHTEIMFFIYLFFICIEKHFGRNVEIRFGQKINKKKNTKNDVTSVFIIFETIQFIKKVKLQFESRCKFIYIFFSDILNFKRKKSNG